MTVNDLENAALNLDARARARLAEKLLLSLETLSLAENNQLWMEEAARRDAELDVDPALGRPGEDVLRSTRARLA